MQHNTIVFYFDCFLVYTCRLCGGVYLLEGCAFMITEILTSS